MWFFLSPLLLLAPAIKFLMPPIVALLLARKQKKQLIEKKSHFFLSSIMGFGGFAIGDFTLVFLVMFDPSYAQSFGVAALAPMPIGIALSLYAQKKFTERWVLSKASGVE
ncbi:hypothetical protein ACMXYN_06885 [Neptuniibacter sp. PT8_73]|uniref:hypothetical protein n=1 Tax=Neptuniibacter sp. PT8_73 TaxID=3398206 RepID=UPI0039F4545A